MTIGVIGGGAWGTALAQMLTSDGSEILLWARERAVVDAINTDHMNPLFLPDIPLSPAIRATGDIRSLADCATIMVVAPAQHLATVLSSLPKAGQDLVLCTKGIEQGSGRFMHEIAAEAHIGGTVAVLSGPTFAHEVARGLPTAVTLAATELAEAHRLSGLVARSSFRPYASTDVAGAEIGGAVKNVLAIACGVVEGAGLGQNARAALIARGFAEMTRFGLAKGARAETLAGLCGLGDLVLTCSSTASRNFSLGKGLGEGKRATALLADRLTVAEGAATAPVLRDEARKMGVDMPVVDAVCALLDGETHIVRVVNALLARPLRTED